MRRSMFIVALSAVMIGSTAVSAVAGWTTAPTPPIWQQ